MMTLQGTALYQWARQEFTGASINDPSGCVYFSTPELTTEEDTFGAAMDSSGCLRLSGILEKKIDAPV